MHRNLAEKISGEITLSDNPGATMRKWRETFGISQQELARHIGVSPSVITDYERGRRKSPGILTVRRLVEAYLDIDELAGGPTINKYTFMEPSEAVLSIREFPVGMSTQRLLNKIEGEVLFSFGDLRRRLYGYTALDSLKAIRTFSTADYLKIYGWSTERALIFTGVEYGRSPMVAIRAHPLKPAIVIFHRPKKVDPLAMELAKLERLTFARTDLELEDLISRLESI